jgi:sec-independent protein translocase protein TatA
VNIAVATDVSLLSVFAGVWSFKAGNRRMNPFLAFLNGYEVVAILAVVLLLFGAKRLPQMARGLGEGMREFRKAASDEESENETKFI